MLDLSCFNFNDEWIWKVFVLSRYDQIVLLRNEHFNVVITIAKFMLTDIERLLFDNLITEESIWPNLGWITSTCISFSFLIKCLSSALTLFLLLNNEIRLTVLRYAILFFNQWEFTDISQHFFTGVFLFLPVTNIVTGFLLL